MTREEAIALGVVLATGAAGVALSMRKKRAPATSPASTTTTPQTTSFPNIEYPYGSTQTGSSGTVSYSSDTSTTSTPESAYQPAGSVYTPPPPERGAQQIFDAQGMLKDLGYDPGAQDGRFGKQTRNALNDFQRAYGYPVTSTLTSKAYTQLGDAWDQYQGIGDVQDDPFPVMVRVRAVAPRTPTQPRAQPRARAFRTY